MLSISEKRYVELYEKAYWNDISADELAELDNLDVDLNLIPCDKCEGEGGFNVPSMAGYGWEYYDCSNCNGLGNINHSETLKEELYNRFVRE